MFELGSSSRKDKILAIFLHPILILLVLYEFRVRNIIIPDLPKSAEQYLSTSRTRNGSK